MINAFSYAFDAHLPFDSLHSPQHASEYGVHWNFFVTLFFVNTFSYFLKSYKERLVVAVVIMAYQCWLSMLGGQEYVQSEDREGSLFYQNREGLLGVPGYIFIYVIAEVVGKVYVWRR